jgi:hypothetical protein
MKQKKGASNFWKIEALLTGRSGGRRIRRRCYLR